MAPRKEKSEKQSLDQGSSLVLEYLRKQNRPYSANDVSSNLHNKVTKANATKHLKELHEAQKIECRVSGKQVVYHALQEAPSASTSQQDNHEDLDARLTDVRTSIAELKSQEKTLKQEVASLSSLRSYEELETAQAALRTQKETMVGRIATLKAANKDIEPVSEAERNRVDAEQRKWITETRLRSEAVKGLWSLVADMREREGLGDMTKDEFWEHIGCEGPMPR